MTLDRTWYNSLHNDTGTGLDGSIWAKEDVDALMDAVDAELNRIDIALADPTIARTNRNNVWTFPQTFRTRLYVEPGEADIAARIDLYDRDQPINSRYWEIHAHQQQLRFWPLNDDQTATLGPMLVLNRQGGCGIYGDLRVYNWIYDRNRNTPIGYMEPYVPNVHSAEMTALSFVTAQCGYSKVGQCVTQRIHVQGIYPGATTAHIKIGMPPTSGGPAIIGFDQSLVKLHIIGGGGDQVGWLFPQSTHWEVHRMNDAPFQAGQPVYVVGTPTYWAAG